MDVLNSFLPTLFAAASAVYMALAVYVSRSSPQSIIGIFLVLIGLLIAGSMFTYGTTDPHVYGVGRTLGFFAAGFLPVAYYAIYRQFTGGLPRPLVIAVLCIIPTMTTILTITNSMHNMIWDVVLTPDGPQFTNLTDHVWFNRVHGPFAYGLFAFSMVALTARLSNIAPAHRRTVTLFIACAALPFFVSVGNNFLGMGPPEFPFLSLSLTILLPVYAYASITLRVHDFSPVAYQTLFNHVRDPIIVLDNNDRIICANLRATELLGRRESELLGRQLWEDVPEARAVLAQASEMDMTQTLKLDASRTYEVNVAPLLDANGRRQGTVVVCRDVTERRKALAQLADSEHLIRTLIETSSNGILRFAAGDDGDRRIFRCVFANRAAETHLGSDSDTLVGQTLSDLQQLEPGRLIAHFSDPERAETTISFETLLEGEDGESWLRVIGEPVGHDFSLTLIDITQRKVNERRMLAEALRDPLTGVLNRRGFEKEATTCIRGSAQGAVLYLDLNQFKAINDRFGHQAGDALLKAFGHRLEFCLRPEDVLGRLGGDEFAIVLPGVSVEDARHIAERLISTASEAYIIQGKEIRCTASVGIALMPQHGEELWHLISIADAAMYNVKNLAEVDAANDRAAYIDAATAEER